MHIKARKIIFPPLGNNLRTEATDTRAVTVQGSAPEYNTLFSMLFLLKKSLVFLVLSSIVYYFDIQSQFM